MISICVLFKGLLPQVNGTKATTTRRMTVLVGVEPATPISIYLSLILTLSLIISTIIVLVSGGACAPAFRLFSLTPYRLAGRRGDHLHRDHTGETRKTTPRPFPSSCVPTAIQFRTFSQLTTSTDTCAKPPDTLAPPPRSPYY